MSMVQTRSNSGPVEDPVSSQALKGDNKSAEGSSRKTIPKTSQKPARGDAPLVSKGMQLLGGQEAPKNPGAIGTGDLIEINAPPGNKKSGRKDEIAAEIELLKKEAKEGSGKK